MENKHSLFYNSRLDLDYLDYFLAIENKYKDDDCHFTVFQESDPISANSAVKASKRAPISNVIRGRESIKKRWSK